MRTISHPSQFYQFNQFAYYMEGHLKIWQGVFSRWKQYYFILHNAILTYCDKKGGTVEGQIYLRISSVIAVLDDPLRIMIHSGTVVLNLRTDHTQERIRWIKALNSAKEQADKQQELKNQKSQRNSTNEQLQNFIKQIWHLQSLLLNEINNLVYSVKQIKNQNTKRMVSCITNYSNKLKNYVLEILDIATKHNKPHQNHKKRQSHKFIRQQSIYQKQWTHLKIDNPFQNILQPNLPSRSFICQQEQNQQSFKSLLQQSLNQQKSDQIWNPVKINDAIKDIIALNEHKKNLMQTNQIFLLTHNSINNQQERLKLPFPSSPSQINIFQIIKGFIGSDIFSLNLPVITNEPLSYLQRLAQQMLYQDLLVTADREPENSKRLLYVMAFATSIYSSTFKRSKLCLKPLIGETYEIFNKQYNYVSEQVENKVSAFYCESTSYILYGSLQTDTKFTGKSIQIEPKGYTYVYLKTPKQTIYFTRCKTTIGNLLFGQTSVHNVGEISLSTQNDVGLLIFKDRKILFDDSRGNEVEGWLKTSGTMRYTIQGQWNEELWAYSTNAKQKSIYGNKSNDKIKIWQNNILQKQDYFYFTRFAINLNNLNLKTLEYIPHTDSRLRPDIRALQFGDLKIAQKQKQRLYRDEKKRQDIYEPKWFSKKIHDFNKAQYYAYNYEYLKQREKKTWKKVHPIY